MSWRRAARIAALLALPAAARAQRTPTAITPSGRESVPCAGQRVDSITVYSSAPSLSNLQRVPWLARVVRDAHMTTRPGVVRRFLLLEPGDACDELRRSESERILREQPFIAEAEIYAVPNASGGVDLEVSTSDETAIVLGGALRARAPMLTSLLVGNANIGGRGLYSSIAWGYGEGFRDRYAVRLSERLLLDHPWILAVEGDRASLGGSWRVEAANPYHTALQRVAWRMRTGSSLEYLELRRPEGDRPAIAVARSFYDMGVLARIGPPAQLSLVGLSLTGERNAPENRLVMPDSGVLRDAGPPPIPYSPHRMGRINLLLGARDLRFLRIVGLDALTATQDVPTGVQIGTQIGRGLRSLGATEPDISLAGDLYLGVSRGRSTTRVQLQGEGRRAMGESVWDDVLTTARAAHYLRITPQHLNTTVVEWSSAERERAPFQLLLGVPQGGVRGYEDASFAGGQRLAVHTEERFVFTSLIRQADLGVALFADAGRVWAGDAPFGVTSPVKTSVGLSLLAAVPQRSARLWRADIAFPLNGGAGRGWSLRFINADPTTFEFRNPRDVVQARALTVPTSVFAWP